jgi:hypothetical protein
MTVTEQIFPCPLTPRTLRRCEVSALAALYFPLAEIDNAVNVAELESGWRTSAWNTQGEDSRGLWQVNVADGAHPQLRNVNLFDPQVNAFYAGRIWAESGWRAWYNSAVKLGLLA